MSATALWRSRPLRFTALGLAVVALVLAVALMPTTTRQGVDFVVGTHTLPAYVKAMDFVDRDLNYRALARSITAGVGSDEVRAIAVFEWTRKNIRDVPPGFPVVDDHIWHIIVRGYGVDDQKADVFTTLTTYAGVPAYFVLFGSRPARLPISVVLVDGRWRVVDVDHGFLFRTAAGPLATFEDMAADPGILQRYALHLRYKGLDYASYFAHPPAVVPPDTLRAEMQMLGPRLAFELKRVVGLAGREWDPERGARATRR